MTEPMITPEAHKELERLKAELFEAHEREIQTSVQPDSPEHLEATIAVGKIANRIKEILGAKGKPWQAL
jgi:hypothetical protein